MGTSYKIETMGRVRTKTVKRASRALIEKYYGKLTNDFHVNKRIIDDISQIQTKRLRNKIAGFTTHLMKRIEKGPVRGISLRLQEEERERKMDFIPERSEIQVEHIDARNDRVLKQMIKDLRVRHLIPGMERQNQRGGNRRARQQQQD